MNFNGITGQQGYGNMSSAPAYSPDNTSVFGNPNSSIFNMGNIATSNMIGTNQMLDNTFSQIDQFIGSVNAGMFPNQKQATQGTQQGYQYPQQGYQYPQQGYQMPQQGYQFPQQGYQMPQQGYQMPQQGYQYPQQGYQMPQQGYQMPQQGYQVPQQGYQNPGMAPQVAPGGFDLVALMGILQQMLMYLSNIAPNNQVANHN